MPAFIRTKKDEARWERAKEKAEEAGFKGNWAYVTAIYKRMNGGRVACSLLRIIALHRVGKVHHVRRPDD